MPHPFGNRRLPPGGNGPKTGGKGKSRRIMLYYTNRGCADLKGKGAGFNRTPLVGATYLYYETRHRQCSHQARKQVGILVSLPGGGNAPSRQHRPDRPGMTLPSDYIALPFVIAPYGNKFAGGADGRVFFCGHETDRCQSLAAVRLLSSIERGESICRRKLPPTF